MELTEVSTVSVPALATWPNVEIAQTGQWDISTGRVTLTMDDFANAIAAQDCPAVRRPVIKLGHLEPMPDSKKARWDGEPAIGYIDNMAVADSGNTIVGDYAGMPGWLGPILPSAYPDRSMEATWDFQCQLGHVHPFVITAVALLGITAPGIGTLESLQDVANLYGIAAASSEPESGFSISVQATAKGESAMPNPRPKEVAAGVTTEDVRRKYYETADYTSWIKEMHLDPPQLITVDEASGDYARIPVTIENGEIVFGDAVSVEVEYVDKPEEQTAAASRFVYASKDESRPPARRVADVPAPEAIKRVHEAASRQGSESEKGTGDMDPVEIRKRLGLQPEATDDDVYAAIAAARQPAPEPTPAPVPPPTVAAGSGVMVVDQSVISALQEQAARGEAAFKMMREQNRDRVISAAIAAGKFAPARKAEFERLYDADPEGTEATIKSLAPGLIPLQAAGYAGAAETAEEEQQYFALFPEEKTGV